MKILIFNLWALHPSNHSFGDNIRRIGPPSSILTS
jgi:hypothetical protein